MSSQNMHSLKLFLIIDKIALFTYLIDMQTTLFQTHDITIEEFKSFLSKEGWIETDPQAREYVFQFSLKKTPRVVIKVYSAIAKKEENPPDRQQIKVFAIDLEKKKPLTKAIHLNKGPEWRNQLQNIILQTFYLAQQRR